MRTKSPIIGAGDHGQFPNAKPYKDHRAFLEQKDPDIVQITTPDYWHATCAIDAPNAAKDVHCENRFRPSLRIWIWAHFLGPLKWRSYDPQQDVSWRAYLDFGGGQVTDFFTYWIDVVHMFMGQEIPSSALAAGVTSAAIEFRGTEGRLWIDRSHFEFGPAGPNARQFVAHAKTPSRFRYRAPRNPAPVTN